MSQLRVLKIIFQGFCRIPVILLVLLKNVVNTLNELILISQSNGIFPVCRFPDSFAALICQFKALKKIETGGMLITRHISEAIADAKLNFHQHVINYELITITKITLSEKYEITDDILYNLANSVKFLGYLSVNNCSLVTDAGIQAITKMKHLENLFLSGKNNVTDTPLKFLRGMKRLELPDSYEITNNSIEEILENSPYMCDLTFKHTSITPEFLTIAMEVSEKRKKNMRLDVQFSGCCVDAIRHKYLDILCGCDICTSY
ncbi:uncharacterized protein LOC122856234 [Aphidius gifuensis]|nr:uncharacterized protein LOC122856234 [Aphidius gifuensis]